MIDERAVWVLDQEINRRGVPVDVALADAAVRMAAKVRRRVDPAIRAQTGDAVTSAMSTVALERWLADFGLSPGQVDAETVTAILALPGDMVPDHVRRVLALRLEGGKASVAKFKAILASHVDGRVFQTHQYCGAHTGRWAARRLQTHNLPRDGMGEDEPAAIAAVLSGRETHVQQYGATMDVLSRLVRPCIQAPGGKVFVVIDYAAIEARGVAWLAGQTDVIKQFATGADVYVEMAQRIYGHAVDKATAPKERHLGKTSVLGCGYGMGRVKFRDTCLKQGLDISEEVAKRAVDTYRETWDRVPALWRSVEGAAWAGAEGRKSSVQGVTFQGHDNTLWCRLPSGRLLAYPLADVRDMPIPGSEPDEDTGLRPTRETLTYCGLNSYTRKWTRLQTWGGTLVENLVQAIARDILADAMLRLDALGHAIVMHVHDEIVIEVDENSAEAFLAEACQVMREAPKWAAGFPVDVEGFITARYRKG